VWGKGEESELIKGSCRSDGFIHLVDLMYHSKDILEHMGGHELAGGFSLTHRNIHHLEESLLCGYEKVRHALLVPKEKQEISGELSLDDVHRDTYKEITLLAPFGVENAKPFFSFKNSIIESAKNFGKEKNHLEVIFRTKSGKKVKSIGFFMVKESVEEKIGKKLEGGEEVTVLGFIEESHFAGKTEVRLRIYDILL
jgi:single-stranded-DNA-specific exonuclease